jgi:hypothetical protein
VARCALGLQPLREVRVQPPTVSLFHMAEGLARRSVASLAAAAICATTFGVGAPAYAAQDMSNVGRCVINKSKPASIWRSRKTIQGVCQKGVRRRAYAFRLEVFAGAGQVHHEPQVRGEPRLHQYLRRQARRVRLLMF